MTRTEEIQAIEQHIASGGLYRARMGECHYGDDGVPYKEYNRNKQRARRPSRVVQRCELCQSEFERRAWQKRKYCSPECGHKAQSNKLSNGRDVACSHCGKMHYRRKARLYEGKGMYCSISCGASAQAQRMAAE